MSHNNEEVHTKFNGTAILSFAIVLVLFVLMSRCHGDYKINPEKAETEAPAGK